MNYHLTTLNNTYEVINFLRTDGKYNIYVNRISNLTGIYNGKALYCLGAKDADNAICIKDVLNLTYIN